MTKLVGQDGTGFTEANADEFQTAGNAIGNDYTASATGTAVLAFVKVGVMNDAVTVKLCLYAGAKTAGGALIAVSNPITLAVGLQSAAFPANAITVSTVYTIVMVPNPNTSRFQTVYNSGSSSSVLYQWTAAHFPYASPPANLPAADVTNSGHAYIQYLTDAPGGGAVAWLTA